MGEWFVPKTIGESSAPGRACLAAGFGAAPRLRCARPCRTAQGLADRQRRLTRCGVQRFALRHRDRAGAVDAGTPGSRSRPDRPWLDSSATSPSPPAVASSVSSTLGRTRLDPRAGGLERQLAHRQAVRGVDRCVRHADSVRRAQLLPDLAPPRLRVRERRGSRRSRRGSRRPVDHAPTSSRAVPPVISALSSREGLRRVLRRTIGSGVVSSTELFTSAARSGNSLKLSCQVMRVR